MSGVEIEGRLLVLRRKERDCEVALVQGKQVMQERYRQMKKEAGDVSKLEADNFITSFLKLLHLHEGKLTKEQEEHLRAKLSYEKIVQDVELLERQLGELRRKIDESVLQKNVFEEAILEKEKALMALPLDDGKRLIYEKFSERLRRLEAEKVEVMEALEALEKAKESKKEALVLLDSAENWAFWDTWGNGGFITDQIKYEKMAEAQEKLKLLRSALKVLDKELSDVKENLNFEPLEIHFETKFLDVWFDNFFTDYQVKEQIIEQIRVVTAIGEKLEPLRMRLDIRLEAIQADLKASRVNLENLLLENTNFK